MCGCISYYSYIKPQQQRVEEMKLNGCISYYSYIKPQLSIQYNVAYIVVYRTIPTSNHNLSDFPKHTEQLYIVLFLHQTTTYNGDIADNQHITITFINKK